MSTDPENAIEEGEAPLDENQGEGRFARRRWILLSAALVVVVVALVVALPLLLVSSDDDPAPSSQQLASTTAAPTPSTMGASTPPPSASNSSIDASAAPTTNAPSKSPSLSPATASPTTLPPSASPTTPATTSAPTAPPTTPVPRSSLVLAVLPDSQYTVEGAPYIFRSQAEWLRDHHAALGYPFVVHVGDVVQSPSAEAQWKEGKRSMDLLAKEGIDYAVSSGNHDIRQSWVDDVDRAAEEPYLRYFGPASGRSVGGRDDTGWSEYHLAEVQGVEMLVLALDWRATNVTVAWAREVLEDHPQTPAMIVSHELLYPAAPDNATGRQSVIRSEYGEYIWQELVATEDQIFLVLCGHISGSGWREDPNAVGRMVPQVLVNYQEQTAGGNGYTRLIEVVFVRNEMRHVTFSPWVQRLWQEEGEDALAPHDLALLHDAESNFTISMNWTERFAGIGAAIPAELTEEPGVPWLDAVRSEFGEVPLPTANFGTPSDADDYPALPETAAHWRFDDLASDPLSDDGGQPVPDDVVVADLSGNGNHLIRKNTPGGLPEHLTASRSSHPLSASGTSLCFANPDRSEGAYLATADGAPLNEATFVDAGYTVEAFVKLPPTFLDGSGPFRWTGVVARSGLITDVLVGEEVSGDTNEPLAVLGVSNLAEAQFASWPVKQATAPRKAVTAWSSPLDLERWYHVAAVNDGNQTRMYVDGWPARRDPVYETGVAGLLSAGRSWLIGASFYADRTKVFGGCIGEVRITARALPVEEMLLSRRKEE